MKTKIIIRDLHLDMLIGIHDHEKENAQPVLVNIMAEIANVTGGDAIENTACYSAMIDKIRAVAMKEHVNLVETLAERIADVLLKDKMIKIITVRVEKTSVYDFAASVGVEITRQRE